MFLCTTCSKKRTAKFAYAQKLTFFALHVNQQRQRVAHCHWSINSYVYEEFSKEEEEACEHISTRFFVCVRVTQQAEVHSCVLTNFGPHAVAKNDVHLALRRVNSEHNWRARICSVLNSSKGHARELVS